MVRRSAVPPLPSGIGVQVSLGVGLPEASPGVAVADTEPLTDGVTLGEGASLVGAGAGAGVADCGATRRASAADIGLTRSGTAANRTDWTPNQETRTARPV